MNADLLRSSAALLCASFLSLTACQPARVEHELRLAGEALGTRWSVVVVHEEPPGADRVEALQARIEATLDRVDRGMSTWRADSELSRFNRSAGAEPFVFTPETGGVVAAALDMARETRGAFDPTVAPLVGLWGFGAQASAGEPGEEQLARARSRVGWQHLAWTPDGGLVRRVPGVLLDLSAIAKGYAVDAILTEVARDRPAAALVEVGGEVRGFGSPPGRSFWNLGIRHPGPPEAGLETRVALTQGALATSGDYEQTRSNEGQRRTHVVDPRTGEPVQNRVASASVVAPTGMQADAIATALMVLGVPDGIAWVEARPGLEALLLVRGADGDFERHASSGWAGWLAPER